MRFLKLYIFLTLLTVALCGYGRQYSVKDLPNVQVQDHTKHFVNPDGIVSAQTAAQIDSLLLDARRQTSSEIVAVIVDDVDAPDLETFATELFNTWKIGKSDKNNGILLIVAKDRRRATIRTGYGAEGMMPDILAGRIINDIMVPHFRDGDYEGGMLAGVESIHKMVTDPEAAAELMSSQKDNYDIGLDIDFFSLYLKIAIGVAIAMLVWLAFMLADMDKKSNPMSDYQKYLYLQKRQLTFWIVALVFMGIPVLAAIVLWLLKYHYRNHSRKCPHCGTKMQKLSEEEDNKYLTYAQDLEEQIKSVDYDVWKCPKCNERDIYSFVNNSSNYHQCPNCKAYTEKLTGTRIISTPTYSHEGEGEKQYTCLNCRKRRGERYAIPKKERPVVVVGPGGGGGRGFGGGFGGGGFGGGFGGGLTGGGGASGGW